MANDPDEKQAAGAAQPSGESPVTPPAEADQGELIMDAVTDTKIVQHNQYAPGGWLKSPAIWEFFVAGEEALTEIAAPDHLQNGQLKRLRVAGFVNGTCVYIWTTHPNDPLGLEIKRAESRTWINMRKLFARMKVSREPGLAVRFDLVPADDKTPVKPALMINLKQPRDTKHFETSSPKDKEKPESK